MRDPFPTVSEGAISDWVAHEASNAVAVTSRVGHPRSASSGNTLKAWCQGSRPQPYRLWATYSAAGIEEAHCSCPVGLGGRCKHVAALLLTWSDQPDSFREVKNWT